MAWGGSGGDGAAADAHSTSESSTLRRYSGRRGNGLDAAAAKHHLLKKNRDPPFAAMRIFIDHLDDLRLQPYRNLKASNLMRRGELFIAEGTRVVDRLLRSDFETVSVLLAEKREAEWLPRIPARVPVYIVPQELGKELVGFNFHVGVVACGRRRPGPSLEQALPKDRNRLTVVVCPNCDNPENLGAILRISRGFGVDLVLLGPGCCDPFSRRVLRVSMGTAFRQPIRETRDLAGELKRLRTEWGFHLVATVVDRSAVPLARSTRPPRLGLLFGNEAAGLSRDWIAACDQSVTIPMAAETDSLNVAVAAGIFLHHFTRELDFAP
jgi:tRNA G18 (ribose-2'-O)-methylase SpoU